MNNAIAYSKEWFVKYQKKKIKNFFLINNNRKLNYQFLKKNKIKYIFSSLELQDTKINLSKF